MKTLLLLATILSIQTASASSMMIDLDLVTSGVQNSISDAQEGDVVEFALVITDFTGDIHCFNGFGGDISSKGSMDVSYSPLIQAGDITSYTNEGFAQDITNLTPITSGGAMQTMNLTPLNTYTQNVGGVGFRDAPSNHDANNNVISFTNVPGGNVPYAIVFTGSMTLTNVAGNTLNMFPSGVFNNPDTIEGPDGVALLPGGPFSFQQDGSIMLHTEPHDFDDQCMGLGSGDLFGATITGVPEPSSTLLVALGGFGLAIRRSRK